MPKKEKTFSAGEVIFKQGEACTSVYTIVDGKAELFYEINGKPRVLGRKGEDDLLGANSVLEGAYDTCARAVTELTVTVLSADEYIAQLQRSGELSPSAQTDMKRKGPADDDDDDDDFNFDFGGDSDDDDDDDDAVSARPSRRPSVPARRRGAALSRLDLDEEEQQADENHPADVSKALVKVEKQKAGPRDMMRVPAVLPAEIKRFPIKEWLKESVDEAAAFGPVVLLASIDRDDDGEIRNEIYRVLREVPNLQVKVIDKAVTDTNARRGALQMRSWMAQHNADVGLYASLDNAGRVLEYHTVRPAHPGDPAGTVPSAGSRFFLPVQTGAEQKTLLKIFTICAMTPTRLEHEQMLKLFLPTLLNEVAAYASKPIPGLGPEEQAVDLTAFANVLSWISLFNSRENRQAQASAVYEAALKLLPPYAPEYVFVNRQVGLLHQMEGERKDDIEAFKMAEETFKKALDALSEKHQPEAVGDLRLRIGNVRQKIALQTGEGEDFVSAMTAYRDALKTLRPGVHTEKWADTVNGLARTMQIFSSYSSKTTLLKKAVELYEKELSVIDREKMPLLWARTSNNLASALFLLADREKSDPSLLRRAVEVFSDALQLYDKMGAHKMATVANSNLKRAEEVLSRTEKELEKNKNWLDDILDDAVDPAASVEKTAAGAGEPSEEPLVFERIAVFEELEDDE